jgi:hypothetical protein
MVTQADISVLRPIATNWAGLRPEPKKIEQEIAEKIEKKKPPQPL